MSGDILALGNDAATIAVIGVQAAPIKNGGR